MAKTILIKCVVALLLASMLVVGLVGCGGSSTTDSTKKPGTSTKPSTSDTPTSSDNPAINAEYPAQLEGIQSKTDGSEVTFVYVEGGNGTYTADSIWVNEEAGDIDDVDNGIIERNNKIQEELGVTITPYPFEGGIGQLQELTKTMFDTQDDTIDVYCGYQYYDISLATQKHLYNLAEIVNDNGDALINIDQPYWATNYINSITYNDYVYWVTGDLALRYTGGLYCTFVNTQIYDEKVKATYEGKSIYEIVNSGEWTFDTMLAMAKLGAYDEDGSGKIEEGEIAGFVYETQDIFDGMAFGCQIQFGKKVSGKTGDEITVALANDTKAKTLAGYFNTIHTSTDFTLGVGDNDSKNMMPYFADGFALFAVNKIYQSAVWLQDMEQFAIIPTPKLNKDQQNYASGCHDSLTIFGISRYTDVPEAAAATLELMAYYGSKLVTPVFYESYILGGRTVREDESIEMINIIRKGFNSDFVAAWSNSIDNIVHIYRNPSNCKNFDQQLKYNRNRWPISLNKLLTALEQASVVE